MKSKILLLALSVAALSSCSTSYKNTQTPDDVYYSPARPQDEYVQSSKQDDRQYRGEEENYYEDQYLRMKVRNRSRWSDIDDPYYYSSRYNSSAYNCCCFGNPWSPSTYWNNYYNPYYHGYIVVNPKSMTTFNRPRTFNLNSYNTNALTNSNYSTPKYSGNSNTQTYSAPRNRNSNKSNSGEILRDVFKGSNNNSQSNPSNNNNSSSSSSSSSSGSSGSSSGSSAPVRKF